MSRKPFEVLRAPIGPDEFRLLLPEFSEAYVDAYKGAPRFDDTTTPEEAGEYLLPFSYQPDFTVFAAVDSRERIIGAQILFFLHFDYLEEIRGKELRSFAEGLGTNYHGVIWEQEYFVKREYQGQGIARRLGQLAHRYIQAQHRSITVVRRIRDDNLASITVAETAQLTRSGVSGISEATETAPEATFEFWHKPITDEKTTIWLSKEAVLSHASGR